MEPGPRSRRRGTSPRNWLSAEPRSGGAVAHCEACRLSRGDFIGDEHDRAFLVCVCGDWPPVGPRGSCCRPETGSVQLSVAAGEGRRRRRAERRPISRATAIATRVETLAFFGVEPDDTVVEIWPGGGWYTEILAPYRPVGRRQAMIAAALGDERPQRACNKLMAANAAPLRRVELADFPAFDASAEARAGRQRRCRPHLPQRPQLADGLSARDSQDYSAEAFRQMYAMLQARRDARRGRPPPARKRRRASASSTAAISRSRPCAGSPRRRASASSASSEINANPQGHRRLAEGVWTLPPALRLGDADRGKYLAIGESDRMTLKFVKPR